MKTILLTAYAVNPYKGSEDAMGWQMILQAARFQKVIAVTRQNNRPAIEQFQQEHPEMEALFANLSFLYFDWPRWTIRWKKGPLLSLMYYYGWQLTLALWLKRKKLEVDIVHNLNFHNDWSPTFLWLLKKPLVWGQVGHHPKIPRDFLLPVYGWKAYLQDRLLWLIKNICWWCDPFLYISKRKASTIICMNTEAAKKLRVKKNFIIHPSVAAAPRRQKNGWKKNFQIISVGRFVPLKGFDLTISSFAAFYHSLLPSEQAPMQLILVGSGPCKAQLQALAKTKGVAHAVTFIDWMPHGEVIRLYDGASVFLFPSHEGAGMAVPEAMSAGLPVVCLKNCGPGEAVHPKSKLSVAYSSYQQTVELLAVRLGKLYFLPEYYKREVALSTKRFDKLFRWDVRGDMLQDVYNRVTKDALQSIQKKSSVLCTNHDCSPFTC